MRKKTAFVKRKIISIVLALVLCFALIPITALAAVTLSLNKTTYGAGETIIVSYYGVTPEQKYARSWVAIAKSGAAAGDYMAGN